MTYAFPLSSPADEAAVLAKALVRAAERLQLTGRALGEIVGLSPASISRLPRQGLDPQSKAGQLGLLLLRAFRSLDSLVGGNAEQVRAWFHAPNNHLGGVPSQLVRTPGGLVDVVNYLDAMRR